MSEKPKIPDFEEIPHRADAEIIAYGISLRELFINALRGMYFVMGIEGIGKQGTEEIISLQDSSIESLMVSFLTEMLFFIEKGYKAEINELSVKGFSLYSRISKFQFLSISKEIKAVTFNEMKIIKKNNSYQTRIVFDI
jgi:SHS2 domain-containing protein